jgi:hypothetical protein
MKINFSKLLIAIAFLIALPIKTFAQVDEDQTGAWYMYFWNTTFNDGPWGLQGDIQHRNWDAFGDLQQLMLRGGVTYTPKNTKAKFTLGYGNITAGEFGSGTSTVSENRIYQEALIPQKLGKRFYLNHRFRYEQRFIDEQDNRTRFRYGIFVNTALNSIKMDKGTVYLALYNELFINGEKEIGNGQTVEYFAVNRLYGAMGYVFSKKLKMQVGMMKQTTNSISKNQLQLSLHHKI